MAVILLTLCLLTTVFTPPMVKGSPGALSSTRDDYLDDSTDDDYVPYEEYEESNPDSGRSALNLPMPSSKFIFRILYTSNLEIIYIYIIVSKC